MPSSRQPPGDDLHRCIVRANGVVPIIYQRSTLHHGSDLSWAMLFSLMSCINRLATLVINAPDFTFRASCHPFTTVLQQLLAIPITFSIVSSSPQVIFREPVWSPVELLDRFLDDDPSHATRFCVRPGWSGLDHDSCHVRS
ncbi:hypothetical protein F5148DRAFT_779455 [Russula earlei]|uniref:Uncharacterized protein n=1 Tax=Russula earlei TaxID=71964 RepID=A0ACC0UC11_9AGAM|nr:hypothetical protein F5148DRAFT_779455 [Russula earlei]